MGNRLLKEAEKFARESQGSSKKGYGGNKGGSRKGKGSGSGADEVKRTARQLLK